MPSAPAAWIGLLRRHSTIGLVLLIALINGSVYINLIPPWQHYDEPGHLEYAWLISDRLKMPIKGDYDQSMRREMAASMIEHGFFKDLDFKPSLLSVNEPIWIGISQVVGSPLYYALVAIPLRLVQYSDITFQLYIGRTLSLVLYLVTIISAYGIVREITPPMHPLRWMVPVSLALFPGFVDIMTAVNDDVGATVAFSLFLWAGVGIIQKGFSWFRAVALVLTTIACTLTKNTVIIAAILVFIPVSMRLFRNVQRRYIFLGTALLGLLVFVSLFRYGDAAFWHKTNSQNISIASTSKEAPVGTKAFQLNSPNSIFQIIPQSEIKKLRGKLVTIGAWIWADQQINSLTPSIKYGGEEINRSVEIGNQPTFHIFTTVLPKDLTLLRVNLSPGLTAEGGNRVYYDGVVLVEGDYSDAGNPAFLTEDASLLTWNNNIVRNYLRNASAEDRWFGIRFTLQQWLARYVPGSPELYASLFQDWRSASWYYQVTLENLHQTFWGKAGWGHVPLIGKYSYNLLAIISIIGIGGTVLSIIRQWQALPINSYLFLFGSGLIIWIFTFIRGLTSITDTLFIPSARYAFPAIIPTALALSLGWLEVAYRIRSKFKPTFSAVLFITFLIGLDMLVIASITNYYYLR